MPKETTLLQDIRMINTLKIEMINTKSKRKKQALRGLIDWLEDLYDEKRIKHGLKPMKKQK